MTFPSHVAKLRRNFLHQLAPIAHYSAKIALRLNFARVIIEKISGLESSRVINVREFRGTFRRTLERRFALWNGIRSER